MSEGFRCFECLHFLRAEMKEGVMVAYCDLRTYCHEPMLTITDATTKT